MNKKENMLARLVESGIEEVTLDSLEYIKNESFLTGSTQFFPDVTDSSTDVDIVIHPQYYPLAKMLVAWKKGLDISDSYYGRFTSILCHAEGRVYNLLFMHNLDVYNKWRDATNKFFRLARNGSSRVVDILKNDKELRVYVFEMMTEY